MKSKLTILVYNSMTCICTALKTNYNVRFLRQHVRDLNKRHVFFIHTAGDPRENHADSAKNIAAERNCHCLGVYYCKGFDTFGPFKLIGGINKHHPDEDEIKQAVRFYEGLGK